MLARARTLGDPETSPLVLMLLMDPFEHDPRVEKEARTLVQAGFRVTVLAWNRFGTSLGVELRDGIRIERFRVLSPRGSKWRAMPRLTWVLAWMFWRGLRAPYAALVCHDLHTWPVGWVLKRVRPRRRVVLDAHEPYAEQILGILPSLAPVRRPLLWAERTLARGADVLLTVSPLMVERFAAMGVKRIYYLPNVPRHRAVLRSSGTVGHSESPAYVIGRIGVISPRFSGIEPLVKVVVEVSRLGVPVRLVLGGPVMNAWEPEFRRMIDRYSGLVCYLGPISTEKAESEIRSFDLLANLFEPLQPKARFGYSTKIFDAMAAGVPVLTSRTAEDQFLVADTGCGLVVDYPFDIQAIARDVAALLKDEPRRRQYGQKGQEAVERSYNWSIYERGLVDLLQGGTSPL